MVCGRRLHPIRPPTYRKSIIVTDSSGINEPIWRLHVGNGPLIATAIHDGHDVRHEVQEQLALSESERLREEDPFTAGWTVVGSTRVVGLRSRFEVDFQMHRTPLPKTFAHFWRSWPKRASSAVKYRSQGHTDE